MSKSLLIVDDSATMRKIIMRTLQTAGLDIGQTEEAGNGNEALEKLRNDTSILVRYCQSKILQGSRTVLRVDEKGWLELDIENIIGYLCAAYRDGFLPANSYRQI